MAVLLGGEINAEAEREAAAQAGRPQAQASAQQLNTTAYPAPPWMLAEPEAPSWAVVTWSWVREALAAPFSGRRGVGAVCQAQPRYERGTVTSDAIVLLKDDHKEIRRLF